MRAPLALGIGIALVALLPARARAEHDMAGMDHGDHGDHHDDGHADTLAVEPSHSVFAAGLAVVGARYDTTIYVGDYEGTVPSLMWMRGRFGAMASVGLYRLQANGRIVYGVGDVMVHGTAAIVDTPRLALGTRAMAMVPTGAMVDGLGMGHAMASLEATAGLHVARGVVVRAAAGYARALAGEMAHAHGAWPLVEPMNMAEVLWSGAADVTIAPDAGIVVGAHAWGGVPAGAMGVTRVAAGGRVGWRRGAVSTALDVQAGLVGDPFRVRAILATNVSF